MTRPAPRVDADTWRYVMSFWMPDRYPRDPGPDGPTYSPGVVVEALIDRIGPYAVVACPALGDGVAVIEQCSAGWINPMTPVSPSSIRSYRGAVADALRRLQSMTTIDGVDDVAVLALSSRPDGDPELAVIRRASDGCTAIVLPGVDPSDATPDAPAGVVWNPDTDGYGYPCDMSTPSLWSGALGIAEGGG